MIRARLTSGEIATYIGPDPNGGHVIRTDAGDMHTVDAFTPEFGEIRTPQWVTSVYQGQVDGICSWPSQQECDKYVIGQMKAYNRITAIGQLVEHQGLYVIADSTGVPLRSKS